MIEEIILGGGCFWCTEAVFNRVKGVVKVIPGYAGGRQKNPSYETVSTGTTGHAEVVKVAYDTDIISTKTLLGIFWAAHDPTTPNRQGADVGSQYRSIIMYTTGEQKDSVLATKPKDAVTEITEAKEFYPAEEYHTGYYDKNRAAPYCRLVIDPKLRKLSYLFITP